MTTETTSPEQAETDVDSTDDRVEAAAASRDTNSESSSETKRESRFRRGFNTLAHLSRRATILTGGVLAVILAVLIVTVAVLVVDISGQRSVDQAEGAALAAAQTRLPAVLSYDFNTIDSQFPKATENLTGSFRDDFSKLSSSVIIPAAHRDSIITKAKVVENSVVSAQKDKVVLLAFVDQETTSSAYQGPRLDGSRVRVTMSRAGDEWLISEITPV